MNLKVDLKIKEYNICAFYKTEKLPNISTVQH